MKFCISSHKDYFPKTFPILNTSLLESGVKSEDIFWFIHDPECTEYELITANTYLVPHNSIDFTGLISVVDLNLKADWWFLLHDTTKVGPKFFETLNSIELRGDTIPVSKHHIHPSANMGLYSWRYIFNNAETILQYKNLDKDIHKFKTKLVETEDDLFKDSIMSLNRDKPEQLPPTDVYGLGTPRIQEHFVDIDLIKIKANWKGFVDKWQIQP